MHCEIDDFYVLDEYELMSFFCVEPIEKSGEDGYVCFEVSDNKECKLRFSYNIFEKSVQTAILSKNDRVIMKTSYEGNVRMSIKSNLLLCHFCDRLTKTILSVSIKDTIEVTWATLRVVDS